MFFEVTFYEEDNTVDIEGQYSVDELPEIEPISSEYSRFLGDVYDNKYQTFLKQNDNNTDELTAVARYLFFLNQFGEVNVLLTDEFYQDQPKDSQIDQVTFLDSDDEHEIHKSSSYSSDNNFFGALKKLTGVIEPTANERTEVVELLRNHFKKKSISKPSIQEIFNGLSAIKRPNYDYAHLYAFYLYGRDLIDISGHRPLIEAVYYRTQLKFITLSNSSLSGRTSNINLQYRLFKTLQAVGVDVIASDFKIPTTKKSLQQNEELWKMMNQ